MLFMDNIVLLRELNKDLNDRLDTWRRVLETHSFSYAKVRRRIWNVSLTKEESFLTYR